MSKGSVTGVFSYISKWINQGKLGDAPIANNPKILVV